MHKLEQMSVGAIMANWPQTIHVFIELRLHCIGCPISAFHRLDDAAHEHGYEASALTRALEIAISRSPRSRGPVRSHRRSAIGDADP